MLPNSSSSLAPAYILLRRGTLPPQPIKLFKEMVYACEDLLPQKGFKPVEIYGYSRREEWKYATVNYEMEGPLIAFGSGATGFTGEYECHNTYSVQHYIEFVEKGLILIAGACRVAPKERMIRFVITRLFICRSMSCTEFEKEFGRACVVGSAAQGSTPSLGC